MLGSYIIFWTGVALCTIGILYWIYNLYIMLKRKAETKAIVEALSKISGNNIILTVLYKNKIVYRRPIHVDCTKLMMHIILGEVQLITLNGTALHKVIRSDYDTYDMRIKDGVNVIEMHVNKDLWLNRIRFDLCAIVPHTKTQDKACPILSVRI